MDSLDQQMIIDVLRRRLPDLPEGQYQTITDRFLSNVDRLRRRRTNAPPKPMVMTAAASSDYWIG